MNGVALVAWYQPAFAVNVVFMVSGVRHDASACPFEVAAGSVTGFRLDGEQGRGSSASWRFRAMTTFRASCGGGVAPAKTDSFSSFETG